MSAVALDATRSMTTAEFLEFAVSDYVRQSGLRWEFDGFAPQAMTGAPIGHNLVVTALRDLIRPRLPDGYRVFSESVFLRVPAGLEGDDPMRAPDVMVTCKPVAADDTEIDSVVLAVEVLSTSSVRTDRVTKLAEYARMTDIECYLIVDWKARTTEVYRRDGTLLRREDAADSQVEVLHLGHGIRIERNAIFAELDSID